MDEETVEFIREINRNQLFLNRRKKKDVDTDSRRSLPNLQLSPTDITAVVDKLKTKGAISASILNSLQNALLDDPKTAKLVLNTHGALRGLVRELSGHDLGKQIASCGCLCNLAGADSKACCTIAKAAGPYIIALLNSLNSELAVTCGSALGNLCATERACEVLIAQGAVGALCDALRDPRLLDAAVCACANLAYVMEDKLPSEHLRQIILSLSQVESDFTAESSQLLSILSSHKDFTPQTLPQEYLKKILEKIPISIENHIAACIDPTTTRYENKKCCEMKYLIRLIANIDSVDVYFPLLESFLAYSLLNHVKRLLDIDDKTMWWLVGNIARCCRNHPFLDQLLDIAI